jgi:hypothetical protein
MVKTEVSKLSKPYYQYADYIIVVARMLHDRETKSGVEIEFNPDFIHPDLVSQLEKVDSLLVNYNGLTDVNTIAVIVQGWEEGRGGHKLDIGPAYHESNAFKD